MTGTRTNSTNTRAISGHVSGNKVIFTGIITGTKAMFGGLTSIAPTPINLISC